MLYKIKIWTSSYIILTLRQRLHFIHEKEKKNNNTEDLSLTIAKFCFINIFD